MNIFKTICAIGLFGLFVYVIIYRYRTSNTPRVRSKPAPQTNPSEEESTITTSARNIVFQSSNDAGMYRTVSGIQKKNCHLTNNRFGQNGQRTNCTELETCNGLQKGEAGSMAVSDTCERRFPGCIIIGVFKGGTKELVEFLAMHPGVVPYPTEVDFFSHDWRYGLEYYRKQMPYSMPGQITIEKSPSYYNHPEVPKRIHAMDPNVKLILMVRDPVDRLISHITYMALIRKEQFNYRNATRLDKQKFQTKIQQSTYDIPFERYLRYFRRSQIHIVESEHFKRDPYNVLHGVERFLRLPHLIQSDDFVFNKLKGFFCVKEAVDKTLARCFDSKRGRNHTIKEFDELRPFLKKKFEPHNKRFFDLTGRTFDWA